MSDNVKALPGLRAPGHAEPDQALIAALRGLLKRAEAGDLQSFIGTGFLADGCRITTWCDTHENVYEMLGSLAWVQAEYVHRHTS